MLAREGGQCRNTLFVDHGVDFEKFAAAGRCKNLSDTQTCIRGNGHNIDECMRSCRGACGVRRLPGPRVGFVGGIDSHTFDSRLFAEVASQSPNVHFVLVGACSLPDGWCRAPNVWLLGQRPYEQVADYMAACDVLIMPWNRSDWIRACNPVKLKEYLAVGRPVVSTPFEELRRYDGLVRVATDSDSFAGQIRRALSEPMVAERLRERVRDETWQAKARQVWAEANAAGDRFAGRAASGCPGTGPA